MVYTCMKAKEHNVNCSVNSEWYAIIIKLISNAIKIIYIV